MVKDNDDLDSDIFVFTNMYVLWREKMDCSLNSMN